MGAPHFPHLATQKTTSLRYHVAGTEKIVIPTEMRAFMQRSWAAHSAPFRRTTSISLQVVDDLGRKSTPVLALAEVGEARGMRFLFCENPYPKRDGGNQWLAVTPEGRAVFAGRNLALCRIYAAMRQGLIRPASKTEPRTIKHAAS